MTSPSGQLTVLIRVITSQKYAVLVRLQDGVEGTDNVGDRTVTKVELVNAVVGAVGVGILFCHRDQLPGVGQGFCKLSSLGRVAGGVDGDFLDIGGHSALFVDDGACKGCGKEGRSGEKRFGEHGWGDWEVERSWVKCDGLIRTLLSWRGIILYV
jgi:hypothetical protein